MSDFEQKYKDWHTYWSYLKSALRLVGCMGVIVGGQGLLFLAGAFLLAEIVGVVEEWV